MKFICPTSSYPAYLWWGWWEWLMRLWWDSSQLWDQSLVSSLTWGPCKGFRVGNIWIVGFQANCSGFICINSDRLLWPLRMSLYISRRLSGSSLMRLRDTCTLMWCWRTLLLYLRWVRHRFSLNGCLQHTCAPISSGLQFLLSYSLRALTRVEPGEQRTTVAGLGSSLILSPGVLLFAALSET